MRSAIKVGKAVGVGAIVLALALLAVRAWVVPALILGQVQAVAPGKVTIRSWWLGRGSAGVLGLTVHEGKTAGSPVWASSARVATDLTLGGMLRGRITPRRITLEAPKVVLRFDRQGELLTPLTMKPGSTPFGTLPIWVARDAQVTIRQEGRPEMVVTRVQGRLAPVADGIALAARSNDPNWGPCEAFGQFDPEFQNGRVDLKTTSGIMVDPSKVEQIPFVPREVWANVLPRGLVDARLSVVVATGAPLQVKTVIGLRGTTVRSTTLDLTAARASGEVVVEGALVRVEHVAGEALGGRVEGHGTMDFSRSPPRFDLALNFQKINVADAPHAWQLDEAGITGKLSGRADLKVVLDPKGADLSGTTGEAEVTGGSIQGIPVKSLKLVMQGQGKDLQYETQTPASSSRSADPPPLIDLLAGDLVALEALPAPAAPGTVRIKTQVVRKEQGPAGIRLPSALTTQIELQDVDIAKLLARVQLLLGDPVPLPIAGKLSLKADATIPLGKLRSVRDYAFHGDLRMSSITAYNVDLGTVAARIDLADGVLELKDFRGRMVDLPNGGLEHPPPALPPIPQEGPLPSGAFRGSLRAEIAPPGRVSARFEGNNLPLGELAAPALPSPTPLAGLVSLSVGADAKLAEAAQPRAWNVRGKADSVRITYRGTMLDRVSFGLTLHEGRLVINDGAARLEGHPLTANVSVDLDAPHAFQGTIAVTGWDVAALENLVPSAPHPSPVSGLLTARAEASGTLAPLRIETKGDGRLDRFEAGPVPLGDVPFRWTTERDTIVLAVDSARPFGGRLQADARIPTTKGHAVAGSATFRALNLEKLTAAMPGQSLKLSGQASGGVSFTIPADVSHVEATVNLKAPDLTVQGVPAEQVRAELRARRGKLSYEVTADSLGGKVKFQGDIPLTAVPAKGAASGELRAANFTLAAVWKALGVSGAATHLTGQGAFDANLRAVRDGPDAGLWAHGFAEFRNLSWGAEYPLGQLRGIVALSPTVWRVEPLTGDLLGGVAGGYVWGTTPERGPKQLGFDFRVDRVALKRVLAIVPPVAKVADGYGTLHLAGRLEETFHATAEMEIASARLLGLPLSELRAPAELTMALGTGNGTLQVRRGTARFAGGKLQGDARFRIGQDRAFQGEVMLAGIDLESILRIESDARRPASGKISGRASLAGPNPALPARYRGRVDLDLTDASLVSVPVFRAIDKFLGAARGGLFETGHLTGVVAGKQLVVEQFTLVGRLAQLHATGTVGFDGQLNLEVLINTNQIIPETGQALVARIPGLNQVLGRRQEATVQVGNFLSNRLLKLRVSGTLRNPSVSADPTLLVAETAIGFFGAVLKLPLGFLK